MNNRNQCPSCAHKKEMTSQEIEILIQTQLFFEADLIATNIRDERLNICENCTELFHHTCAKCGCFAKFRASLTSKNCPIGKW